jgi:hypothetical protein
VGLALKCDETEAGRSGNTLQNVKNYKSLANVKKNYIFAQTIFTHFLGQYPFLLRGIPIGVKREKVRIWNI